jgi:hypothetical protein
MDATFHFFVNKKPIKFWFSILMKLKKYPKQTQKPKFKKFKKQSCDDKQKWHMEKKGGLLLMYISSS